MSGFLRRIRPVLLLVVAVLLVLPAAASADGDPGSQVLLAQNLFVGGKDGVTPAQQVKLTEVLSATQQAGAPIRVAIIGQRADLRQATEFWTKPPSAYAEYLAANLSAAYTGRVLVVMPSGMAAYWWAHRAEVPALNRAISDVHVSGHAGSNLVGAANVAVSRLESAAGVSSAKLQQLTSSITPSATGSVGVSTLTGAGTGSKSAATPSTTASKSGNRTLTGILAVVLVAVLIAYIAYRKGWRPARRSAEAEGDASSKRRRFRITPLALLPTMLLAFVVVALVINQSGGSGTGKPLSNLSTNPEIDPGSKLAATPAPNFTLYDQTGQKVSLSQYRGKVVILSFIDAECQTICPLTTEAMLDAKRALGPAASKVQLLGVNANWKSTQIADVLNYTLMHGMTGQWQFLTGTPQQLSHVWTDYKINEQPLLSPTTNAIDHVAVTYVIDQQGRLREEYSTQNAYSAIPQFGQVLATEAASLLPGHPKVNTHYSYAQVKGITPAQTVSLPTAGGKKLMIGPSQPHVYLFFATWDQQSTSIGAELVQLNTYNRYAAKHGLPSAIAVDEGSVEPSPSALPDFLKTLPEHLNYPVVIDHTGQLADGFEVQGEPWFVLTSKGKIAWYQEGYLSGVPGLESLERQVKAALSKPAVVPSNATSVKNALAGSPKRLAQLHSQASSLLSGGTTALYTALTGLNGYPKVVNIWASWCVPCQQEFPLFASASVRFGKQVAFLGADNNDHTADARVFLKSHLVSYPSFQTTSTGLERLLPGGVEGTPTTVFIGPTGKILHVHIGQYLTQGSLDADIERYALGLSG